jgi:type IV pilus assembly protein PilA
MKNVQKGFTLIELMIVVAIIGILAAIAIPSYNDYIARTQVSEAMTLTSGVKTPLAEWYSDKGYWPADLASVSGVTDGKYVASIALDTSDGAGIGVVATMRATGVNNNIASGDFAIYTTNGEQWTCGELPGDGSGADQFTDIDGANGTVYLPGACK